MKPIAGPVTAFDPRALERAKEELTGVYRRMIDAGHTARAKVNDAWTDAERAYSGKARVPDVPWTWTLISSFRSVYNKLREARQEQEKAAWAEVEKAQGFVSLFQNLVDSLGTLHSPLEPQKLDLRAARFEYASREAMLGSVSAIRKGVEAAGECEATKNFPTAQLQALEAALKADLATLEADKGPLVRVDRPLTEVKAALDPDALRLFETIERAFRATAWGEMDPLLEAAAKSAFDNRHVQDNTKGLLLQTNGFGVFDVATAKQITDRFDEKGEPISAKELAEMLLARNPSGLFADYAVALARREFPKLAIERPTTPFSFFNSVDRFAQLLVMDLARRDPTGTASGKQAEAAFEKAFRANGYRPLSSDQALCALIDLRPGDETWKKRVNDSAIATSIEPEIDMPHAFVARRRALAGLVAAEIAPFDEPVLREIRRATRDLPDARPETIASRKLLIDRAVDGASLVRRELEAALEVAVLAATRDLAVAKSERGDRPLHEYSPFDAKISALKTEGEKLLREGATAIDQRSKAAKDELDAIERMGSIAEKAGAKDAREGKATRDSVRAASYEQLAFMRIEPEVRQAINRLRGLGLDDKAYARVWSDVMIESAGGLIVRKESGSFAGAVLALDRIVQDIGSGVSAKTAAEWIRKQLPTARSWLHDAGDKAMLDAWAQQRIASLSKV